MQRESLDSGRRCGNELGWLKLDIDRFYYRKTGWDDKELSLREIKLKVVFLHQSNDIDKVHSCEVFK